MASTEISTLSLHDALPISGAVPAARLRAPGRARHRGGAGRVRGEPLLHVPSAGSRADPRSEEHTSELQSRPQLVCRLLLEKKNTYKYYHNFHIPPPNSDQT